MSSHRALDSALKPSAHARALAHLAAQDRALEALVGLPGSLCPGKPRATTLEQLGASLLRPQWPDDVVEQAAQTLGEIALAQAQHFPETIFWDLDYLAACLLHTDAPRTACSLRKTGSLIVGLQAQFGRGSVLSFRYVHDFSYGYDWARWTAKNPKERAHIGPFDDIFLKYLVHRGHELAELIAQNDAKYHQIPQGQPRNPFAFSREPKHEHLLLQTLAARDLIPVAAWDIDAQPRWNQPFAELRKACAREMGIPTRN